MALVPKIMLGHLHVMRAQPAAKLVLKDGLFVFRDGRLETKMPAEGSATRFGVATIGNREPHVAHGRNVGLEAGSPC